MAFQSGFLMIMICFGFTAAFADSARSDTPVDQVEPAELIIRADDMGFCHGANLAFKRALENGSVTAVSLMVNSPWLDEAVVMLKQHPEVSVGVHLTLNCEWREYRLGPVSPVRDVPSLVDENGHFWGTRTDLMAARPKLEEVEKELRAQIDRAMETGLRISYCDYHMGAAVGTFEFQQIVEKLAKEYNIGISRYFNETDSPNIYAPAPKDKLKRAIEIINELPATGRHLVVFHPGTDCPEMAVMSDLNSSGPQNMSKHRQAETDVLCHPDFRKAIEARGFKLVTYDDLKKRGLDKMQRPWVKPPYDEVVKKAIKDKKARKKEKKY